MRSGDGQRAQGGSRTEGKGGRGRCGHLRGAEPPRVRCGCRPGLGPWDRHEASDVVPAGVLRGVAAAAAAPLPAEAAPLPRDCAAATAAGGRSEGDTVAPRRKPGLPQPGPRRGRPGCPLRLSLPRRPPPTRTYSGVATRVEGTVIPRGELSRTVQWGRGEKELEGHGSGSVRGSPRSEGRGTAEAVQRHPRGQEGRGHARHDGRGDAARGVTCTPPPAC